MQKKHLLAFCFTTLLFAPVISIAADFNADDASNSETATQSVYRYGDGSQIQPKNVTAALKTTSQISDDEGLGIFPPVLIVAP